MPLPRFSRAPAPVDTGRPAAVASIGMIFTAALAALIAVAPFAAPARAEIRIVAIGDSNLGAPGVSREDAYPAQLERALRAKGHDVTVANMGINGDTTRGVLGRLDHDVPEGTQIALVAIGVNDIAVHHIDRNTIAKNLTAIVERLRARKIEVLLFGIGNLGNPQCCAGKRLADATGSLYYRNFQDAVIDDPKLHVEDERPVPGSALLTGKATAWHLNKKGYAIVVERTLPLVEELIARVEKGGGTKPVE